MIDNARNTYIEISQLTILVAAWHRANTTYFGSIQICIDRFHSKSGSERFVTQNVMCGKKNPAVLLFGKVAVLLHQAIV